MPTIKFGWPQVLDIRREYELGKYSQHDLAKRYGVSQTQIWRIVTGIHWKKSREETR